MKRITSLIVKRIFDIMIGFCGLVIFLPFWLVIIAAMELTMPGPVFFRQERIGRGYKVFDVLKFRTMRVDKEAEQNLLFFKDKERITALGRLLRRTKIDETPQLINVLKGDMSLVGPRPSVKQRIDEFPERQNERLRMRPGMTGLAQTKGNILLSWPRRIEYDCEYVEKFSILLDIKILLNTVKVILYGEEKYISEFDLKNYKNPMYDIIRK